MKDIVISVVLTAVIVFGLCQHFHTQIVATLTKAKTDVETELASVKAKLEGKTAAPVVVALPAAAIAPTPPAGAAPV